MARRAFFSFHFERDIWRTNQVRNCNVVHGPEIAGYFDHSEYEEAKRGGYDTIRRMIDKHLQYTTVTVVLIGAETASRPWVQYEIEQSIARRNGLVGIRIHDIPNAGRMVDYPGPLPAVPYGVEFPVHDWRHDARWFADVIEAAGKRADWMRA